MTTIAHAVNASSPFLLGGASRLPEQRRAIHLYVQLVGHHAGQPERLLIRSSDRRWYVWFGDRMGAPLHEINEPIAEWLQQHPDVTVLPEPHFWFHVDDLPTVAAQLEQGIHPPPGEAHDHPPSP